MTTQQIQLVKKSWTVVTGMDPVAVGSLFYNRLFEIAPQVKPLFQNSMPEQSKKLLAMISYVINKLDALDDIIAEAAKLAKRHVQYGVKEEHYSAVGEALLWTLEKGLDKFWHKELKEAWTACYTILSGAMIKAANVAEADV